MIVQVNPKQSVFDVCLQHTGDIENLFEFMKTNGLVNVIPDMTNGVEVSNNQRSNVIVFYRQNGYQLSNLPNNISYDFDGNDFNNSNNDFI